MATFLSLQNLLRQYTQESTTIPLSLAILSDLLNEAQTEAAHQVEYSSATFTASLVTGQYDYSITGTTGGTMLSIISVSVNSTTTGSMAPIRQTTHQQMDAELPSWRYDDAGQPVRWWLRANAVWVHPKPSASWNATNLEIRATRIPPDMSADGDLPIDLPDAFHRALAQYGAWQWYAVDKENPSSARWAGYWENRWMRSLGRLRQFIEGRSQTDPPMLRIATGRVGGGLLLDQGDE